MAIETDERQFPILQAYERNAPSRPKSVPWAIVEPHRKRVQRNHGQMLERLAERGGLSPLELYLAMHDRGLFDQDWPEDAGRQADERAIAYIVAAVAEYRETAKGGA